MNNASITGTLVWAPRTNQTKTGTPVTSFTVTLDDDQREHPSKIEVSTFGDLAEQSGTLEVGDKVEVHGSLYESRWQDKQTQEWKQRVSIRADTVQALEVAVAATSAVDDIPF